MPLKIFKHKETEDIKRVLNGKSPGDNWEEVIIAPNGKFMIAANVAKGTSKLKDSKGMLTERARNHQRDTAIDDSIQLNISNKLGVANNLLNENGRKRRKIDDI